MSTDSATTTEAARGAARKLDEVAGAASEKLHAGLDAGKARAAAFGRSAGAEASRIIGDMRNDASDLADRVRQALHDRNAREIGGSLCGAARRHPFAAAGVAAGIGFFAARCIKSRRQR